MNNIFVRGSALIDTIVISARIMQFIEGYKLFETNHFIIADRRAYMVDMNLKEYFEEQLSY